MILLGSILLTTTIAAVVFYFIGYGRGFGDQKALADDASYHNGYVEGLADAAERAAKLLAETESANDEPVWPQPCTVKGCGSHNHSWITHGYFADKKAETL